MYKLYGHPQSEYTQKVAMFLEALGHCYQFVGVDLDSGAHLEKPWSDKLWTGMVPVLDGLPGGIELAESQSISRYLWHAAVEHPLYVSDLMTRACADAVVDFMQYQLLLPLNELAWFGFWLPKRVVNATEEQRQDWRRSCERAKRKCTAYMQKAESTIVHSPFFSRDKMTYVSLSIYAGLQLYRCVADQLPASPVFEAFLVHSELSLCYQTVMSHMEEATQS
ncbi:MAG: glutathione S-transferase [Zetaproteobacteria bacterium]|nr:glutathione S-transferase [Zetaproteobacteria bacterium]